MIGLTGYAGAGKDAVAAILVAELGYVRIAFADPIRAMLRALDPIIFDGWRLSQVIGMTGGWDAAKQHPEVRRLLQRLGTEAGRGVLGEDVWLRVAMERAYAARYSRADGVRPGIVFSDVRFPNEAAAIRARGGRLYRVERPGVGPAGEHASERPEQLEVDGVIANSGDLAALKNAVLAVFSK